MSGLRIAGDVLCAIVAAEHLGFLYLEAVLWTTPRGRAVFNTTAEQAAETAALAKNQGVYNGFLAAALVWGIVASGTTGYQFKIFGTVCVLVAAVVGALTVSRRILIVQGVPAAIALILVLAGGH